MFYSAILDLYISEPFFGSPCLNVNILRDGVSSCTVCEVAISGCIIGRLRGELGSRPRFSHLLPFEDCQQHDHSQQKTPPPLLTQGPTIPRSGLMFRLKLHLVGLGTNHNHPAQVHHLTCEKIQTFKQLPARNRTNRVFLLL